MEEKNTKLLTVNVWKGLLFFSLPLIASNLLQVLFNMADIAVVGKFAGSNALGSVGSTAIVVNLFIGLLIGMGTGVNVVIARFIGAKDYDSLKKANISAFYVCLCAGIILFLLGFSLAKPILLLLKTKEELLDDAILYLRLLFIGLPFLAVYNYGSNVYAANGNTKRPLLFLSIAGVLNVGLNFLFVLVFKMGVAGVAISSAISQMVSCGLIISSLILNKDIIKLSLKEIKPDKKMILFVLRIGVPSGLQNSIFAIANMFIQSGINSLPTEYVSGFSATSNADTIIWEAMYAFYIGAASFISQNYAAGKKKRVLEAYFASMTYAVILGMLLGGLLYPFGKQFISLFTNDEVVINAGYERLLIMGGVFFLAGFMDNAVASCRGLGKTIIPTIMCIAGSCVFRIVWLYAVFYQYNTLLSLCLVYPISWIITSIMLNIYFVVIYKKQTKEFVE